MEALEELIEAILRLISPPFSAKIWPDWPQIRYIGTGFGLKKGWCHNFDFPWFSFRCQDFGPFFLPFTLSWDTTHF